MTDPDRADPLGDISDFAPAAPAKPKAPPAVVRKVSEANGFASRAPAVRAPAGRPSQRRHRTGRNVQINIKAKQETIDRFIAIAEVRGWVLGEALDHAVDLLERAAR